MHESSKIRMTRFAELCSSLYKGQSGIRVCDVAGVGLSYSDIFKKYMPECEYVTLNVELPGIHKEQNCNVTVADAYDWVEIPDSSFDIVISGQAFEHIEYFWITILEMRRILKDRGFICIIAPSHWGEHRTPYDCWRFYTDGMNAIAKFGGFDLLYSGADHPNEGTRLTMKGDAYVVAQKNGAAPQKEALFREAASACRALVQGVRPRELSRGCVFLQSSHMYEDKAGVGADYNIVSNNFTGQYSLHTARSEGEFVMLDLGGEHYITEIRIFNRQGFESRAEALNILISSDLKTWHECYRHVGWFGGIYDAKPFIGHIEKPGRYVRIENDANEFINLDQVQVFGY